MMRIMLTTIITIILVIAIELPVGLAMEDEEQQILSEYIAEIEVAIDQQSAESLVQLGAELSTMCESFEKPVRKYACYYAGYSYYRLGTSFPDLDESQQDDYLDEAISYLEKSIEIDPEFAEAYSLKGSSYGSKISGMFSGMRYGNTAGQNLEKGLELAPENPRTVMLHAISLLFTPSMFGGSTEKAASEFQKATELFESWNPDHELQPEWGYEESYTWLGIAYREKGEYEKALETFRQVLEINPEFAWVRDDLLPELKEEMD